MGRARSVDSVGGCGPLRSLLPLALTLTLTLVTIAAAAAAEAPRQATRPRYAQETLRGWVPVREDAVDTLRPLDRHIYLHYGQEQEQRVVAVGVRDPQEPSSTASVGHHGAHANEATKTAAAAPASGTAFVAGSPDSSVAAPRAPFPFRAGVRFINTDEFAPTFDSFPDVTKFPQYRARRGAPDPDKLVTATRTIPLQQADEKRTEELKRQLSSSPETKSKQLVGSAGLQRYMKKNRLIGDVQKAIDSGRIPPPEVVNLTNTYADMTPDVHGDTSILEELIKRGYTNVTELRTLPQDAFDADIYFSCDYWKSSSCSPFALRGLPFGEWPSANWTAEEWDANVGAMDFLTESSRMALLYFAMQTPVAESMTFWEERGKPDKQQADAFTAKTGLPPTAIPYWRPPHRHRVDVDFMDLKNSVGTDTYLYGFINLVTDASVQRVLHDYEAVSRYLVDVPVAAKQPHDSATGSASSHDSSFAEGGARKKATLWVSTNGGTANMHYDTSNIFHAMLQGRKRFYFFSPEHVLHGYFNPPYHPSYRNSNLCLSCPRTLEDVEAILDASPALFALNEVFVADIGPGDAVFFPAFWIHEVKPLDDFVVSLSTGAGRIAAYTDLKLENAAKFFEKIWLHAYPVQFQLLQAYFTDIAFGLLHDIPGETSLMCQERASCITNVLASVIHRQYLPLGVFEGFRGGYPCVTPLAESLARIEADDHLRSLYKELVAPAARDVVSRVHGAMGKGPHIVALFHRLMVQQLQVMFHWAEAPLVIVSCFG